MSGGSTTWSSMLTRIRSSTCMAVLPEECVVSSPYRPPGAEPSAAATPLSDRGLHSEERGRGGAVGDLTPGRADALDGFPDELLVARPPPPVVLEADAQVTAAGERELGQIGREQVTADDRDRPRER